MLGGIVVDAPRGPEGMRPDQLGAKQAVTGTGRPGDGERTGAAGLAGDIGRNGKALADPVACAPAKISGAGW